MRIDKSQAFEVLDVVETDFSGVATRHVIAERFLVMNSQSGVVYRVVPAVKKSGGATSRLDHGWFQRVGRLSVDGGQIVYQQQNGDGSWTILGSVPA